MLTIMKIKQNKILAKIESQKVKYRQQTNMKRTTNTNQNKRQRKKRNTKKKIKQQKITINEKS